MKHKTIEFLEHIALNIRIDSLRATTEALSGHPTSCLSAADIIAVLFFHVLKYDYENPLYSNNDRFILSKGHAVPVFYAALRQLGIISEEQLLSYRKIDSDLEGHPTPRFVYNEAATGSLGQGLSVGLGMALNAVHYKLSYKTYVMIGDGEQAEGSVWEAAELASHYNLDNLVAILDCNKLGQSDETLHAHQVERYAQKFQAFGWHTIVIDGHHIASIIDAFDQAGSIKGKPIMIVAKTIKGCGLHGIENKLGYHGKPFKNDELPVIIESLRKHYERAAAYQPSEKFKPHKPENKESMPNEQKAASKPELGTKEVSATLSEMCANGKKVSTRKAFGLALAELGINNPQVWALDADVKNSTFTEIFESKTPERFVQCFIAEQNMVGVASGLALRGNIPFASTFACFFTRAYDQLRMAGIGRVPLRLCGSHSGVSIGQDGPSQMGLEDISMIRAIPNSVVLWPSDAVCAYKLVAKMAAYTEGISYMKSTRADMPLLYTHDDDFHIGGNRVLKSSAHDVACIITAGITLYEALEAYEQLKAQGVLVSVIDLYSIKPLDTQTVLQVASQSNKLVLTVEDHYPQGGLGEAVLSAVRNSDIKVHSLAVDKLARSGEPEELLRYEGINSESIVDTILTLKT